MMKTFPQWLLCTTNCFTFIKINKRFNKANVFSPFSFLPTLVSTFESNPDCVLKECTSSWTEIGSCNLSVDLFLSLGDHSVVIDLDGVAAFDWNHENEMFVTSGRGQFFQISFKLLSVKLKTSVTFEPWLIERFWIQFWVSLIV